MVLRYCAYCGSEGPLTREHIWPKSLRRRLVKANDQKQSRFWLAKIKKVIVAEPTICDVCSVCNNIRLSSLDNYICELFDRFFIHIPQRYEHVTFDYDYHRLKRWLLKISFNSARIESSRDAFVFAPLLPYILGNSESVGRAVLLYVQLSYPGNVPEEFLSDSDQRPQMFLPTMNRIGHMWFDLGPAGRKLLRAIHLRAFLFLSCFL